MCTVVNEILIRIFFYPFCLISTVYINRYEFWWHFNLPPHCPWGKSFYNFQPFGDNYKAALLSSVRETVRQTAVGVFHSYLSCWLPFPLCLSLFPSPPSSSSWVPGTFSDSKSLAPSHTGSPFHSTKRRLTIIRAVSALTFSFELSVSFPLSVLLYTGSISSI